MTGPARPRGAPKPSKPVEAGSGPGLGTKPVTVPFLAADSPGELRRQIVMHTSFVADRAFLPAMSYEAWLMITEALLKAEAWEAGAGPKK